MDMGEETLKFVPFSSSVNPSFWYKLSQLKLDVDRLQEPKRKIWGYFNNIKNLGNDRILSVDCSSFNEAPDEGSIAAYGIICNKNTLEGFKNVDKSAFLADEGKVLLDLIKSGEALEEPHLLLRFTILCFADLKKHKFTYWFAFPALNVASCRSATLPRYATDVFSDSQLEKLCETGRTLKYFVMKVFSDVECEFYSLKDGFTKMRDGGDCYIVLPDSSFDVAHPGWPFRNILALFAHNCPSLLDSSINLIGLRFNVDGGKWSAAQSIVVTTRITVSEGAWIKPELCVGWERNEKGNFGPRMANLLSSMNPMALAESSVDLNLKLMKWQVMPDLNLDVIKETKCLLLGAGTLGCVVARALLGWGVRHITLIDNASVSYSNPVRQSLYNFPDVGKAKAPTAALALKSIFPAVVSEGIVMSIPMPGHPVGESLLNETKESVAALDNCIQSHDVIFLLMDSRESRWLPTVMGAAHKKLVINAALGFDSYLVMRHGAKSDSPKEVLEKDCIPGDRLGCYFCNDVTAPGNSGQARTLDQQCTVTRPGVSNIAGSLAVELMVSVLQHDERGAAPAHTKPHDGNDCILGLIPHSIRGFLSNFQTILPAVESFSSCVGCCTRVVSEYQTRGFDFVLQVLESKKYLEDLTGLSELQNNSLLDDILDLSSDENEAETD